MRKIFRLVPLILLIARLRQTAVYIWWRATEYFLKTNGNSASREIPHNSRNLNVHHCFHNSPIFIPILSQINSIHTYPYYFLKFHPDIILPPAFSSSKQSTFLQISPPVVSSHLQTVYNFIFPKNTVLIPPIFLDMTLCRWVSTSWRFESPACLHIQCLTVFLGRTDRIFSREVVIRAATRYGLEGPGFEPQ
jgi:hypothetical protein